MVFGVKSGDLARRSEECAKAGARLQADAFDHADPCHGRYDSRELEASGPVEGAEFDLGTLASACAHKHVDIVRRRSPTLRGLVDARRVYTLDNQELGLRAHRPVTVPENRDCSVVVPVVDDMFENVGVAAGRHFLKEIPADRLAARGETALCNLRLRGALLPPVGRKRCHVTQGSLSGCRS